MRNGIILATGLAMVLAGCETPSQTLSSSGILLTEEEQCFANFNGPEASSTPVAATTGASSGAGLSVGAAVGIALGVALIGAASRRAADRRSEQELDSCLSAAGAPAATSKFAPRIPVAQQREIILQCARERGGTGGLTLKQDRVVPNSGGFFDKLLIVKNDQTTPQVARALQACADARVSRAGNGGSVSPVGAAFAGSSQSLAVGVAAPRTTQPTQTLGCVPGGGTFQRGTLICPGANR